MLLYSDYVAISTYPYWIYPPGNGERANPADLPPDWFAQWASLAPDKPFVIAETAYPAEDLVMKENLVTVINIQATEQWQADYIQWMFEELNKLDAEFISWFVPRDYDQGWEFLKSLDVNVFDKFWRDTGLIDGEGNARQSLTVWDAWLELPAGD